MEQEGNKVAEGDGVGVTLLTNTLTEGGIRRWTQMAGLVLGALSNSSRLSAFICR